MTEPTPLLVPMAVQALLVNSLVQNDPDRQFARWTTDYAALDVYQDPLPAAFTESDAPPPLGVHLHWKLPSAFTHGRSESVGSAVAFPYLPNRWMVGRLATPPTGGPALLAAWIVESDYLDPANGSSNFADPFTSQPGAVTLTRVGRSMAAEQWSEPGHPLFLRATGLADVTFTAYQPGLLDVLSFHDPMEDVAENSSLTYWVCGWYSDPAHDILATATPQALDWLSLGDAAATPTLCVLHGMVRDLTWQNTTTPKLVDPDASAMKIGVGYTSVDALAAILDDGQSGGDIEMNLQAFQYGLLEQLDEPDGRAQTELRIRRAWFGSTPGGVLWRIVPLSQGQSSGDAVSADIVTPPPPLSADQVKWLADLNRLQRRCDQESRMLKTLQWELFALWWKSKRAPFLNVAEQQQLFINPAKILAMIEQSLDPANSTGMFATVSAQQTLVSGLVAQLPDATSSTSIARFSLQVPDNAPPAKDQLPPLTLRPSALTPFHHPTDPVVMVAGMTPPSNAVDEGGGLPCRTIGAAVTGVTVGSKPVTRASGSLASAIALPPVQKLATPVAAAVTAIAIEAFFANPSHAAVIVQDGLGGSDQGTIAALSTAMAAGTAQISTVAQPLQAAFAFASWTQAWSPLFLQWAIDWWPTVASSPIDQLTPPPDAVYPPGQHAHGLKDNWAFLQSGWRFDGGDDVIARGGEYDCWTGGNIWTGDSAVTPRAYAGRTFLTPHATDLFLDRIARYVALHPDDEALGKIESIIQAIGETHILSQTLSGFNDALVMRGLSQSAPPPKGSPIAMAIGGEGRASPLVGLGDQDLRWDGGSPFFFPVRGGYFAFRRLVIVDAFGQVLDLLYANGNSSGDAQTFQPIEGAGLSPGVDGGAPSAIGQLRQAPRIVQPARLNIRLLDATDDGKEIYYDAGADPVCGWLLPNHLDRSIAVYDASGAPLGELLVLAQESGKAVQWLSTPDVVDPVIDPSQIANRHLAALLSAFTAPEGLKIDRTAAFRALYGSIDETLWTVDPPGGQSDHDLAVLIGRPLAVVRAQVQFELFGRPTVNQSWRDTLQAQDANLTTFSFPIRLGSAELLDDGLIGYFTADDYTRFNAVHASSTATSPYVAPIAPGNYLSLPFDYPTYSTVELTMLIDPRGKVHATTGLLPIKTVAAPPEYYVDALTRLAVTFRVGPALTRPDAVRIPLPADHEGSWSWIRRIGTGTDAKAWEVQPIVAVDASARLPDKPPWLMEGWLRFTPNKGL